MTILYLIAHKVRNEPAFDIAQRDPCPECAADGCPECDGLGYWWIVPTSGHRAYPYWNDLLANLDDRHNLVLDADEATCQYWGREYCPPPMPPDLPDHYPLIHVSPTRSSLSAILGLSKPKPPIKLHRRI